MGLCGRELRVYIQISAINDTDEKAPLNWGKPYAIYWISERKIKLVWKDHSEKEKKREEMKWKDR